MGLAVGPNLGVTGFIGYVLLPANTLTGGPYFIEGAAMRYQSPAQFFTYHLFGAGFTAKHWPTSLSYSGSIAGAIVLDSTAASQFNKIGDSTNGRGTLTLTLDTGKTITGTVWMENIAISLTKSKNDRHAISFNYRAEGAMTEAG